MIKNWTEFQGDTLYLDTMVPYALLRGLENRAAELFSKIEQGDFTAYTSVLTFDELAYRLLLALIRDNQSGSPLEHLRDNQTQMISQYYPQIMPKLALLRTLPNLILLPVTAADLPLMDEAVAQYHLRPRDALHYAAMQKCNCFTLISEDTDFDRLLHIHRFTLTS